MLADLAKCEPVLALCSPCKVSLLLALGAALALTGPRVRVLQLGWHRVLKLLVFEACGGSTGTE